MGKTATRPKIPERLTDLLREDVEFLRKFD